MQKCRNCLIWKADFEFPLWAASKHDWCCKPCLTVYGRKLRRTWHDRAIEILGNKCYQCGFDDKRALQIDHKDGKGNIKRHSPSGHRNNSFYRRIVNDKEFRQLFQCLCANHNWIKRYEKCEGVRSDRFEL